MSQPRKPVFLPSALVLVVLPALAGGALGAFIGVLLAPDSLVSGVFGAFFGALAGPSLALFAWFLCGAWRRPLAPAWITGFPLAPAWITWFYVIGLAVGLIVSLPLGAIASVSSAALFVILGVVVLLEWVVILLQTYRWRRRRHSA